MANEELSGAAGGIASALSEVSERRLQFDRNEIQRGYNETRKGMLSASNRADTLAEEKYNAEAPARKLAIENAELDAEKKRFAIKEAEDEDKRRNTWITTDEVIDDMYQGDVTPGMRQHISNGLSTYGIVKNGAINEQEWKEFTEKASKGEQKGFFRMINGALDTGIKEAGNLAQEMNRRRTELLEKKPYLQNPEAAKMDKEMSGFQGAIENLKNADNKYRMQQQQIRETTDSIRASREAEEKLASIVRAKKINQGKIEANSKNNDITSRSKAIGLFIENSVKKGDTLEDAIKKANELSPPSEVEKALVYLMGMKAGTASSATSTKKSASESKTKNLLELTDEDRKAIMSGK